jgi:hypothetical protein
LTNQRTEQNKAAAPGVAALFCLAFGFWLLAIGFWPLAINVYRLPNTMQRSCSCWLLAVNNFVFELWLHLSIIQASLILLKFAQTLAHCSKLIAQNPLTARSALTMSQTY